MADLKIPNLNVNSDKYIFKKKLTLRRKSKRRLITESTFMFILSLLLIYINYLIPNKIALLQSLPLTLNRSFILFIDLCSNIYKVLLVVFILISMILVLILLIGSFYRIFRILNIKSRKINYK